MKKSKYIRRKEKAEKSVVNGIDKIFRKRNVRNLKNNRNCMKYDFQ